ncbi:hypothetical protein YC2023_031865 [Brassica napus]
MAQEKEKRRRQERRDSSKLAVDLHLQVNLLIYSIFNNNYSQFLDVWNFGAEVSVRSAYPSSKNVKD